MQIAACIARSLSSSSSTLVSFSVYRFRFISDLRDYLLKHLLVLIVYSLTISSPDEERVVDLGTFVDEEEGDIDDESDVELDLDLDSEHNDDDLESDTEIV